MKKYVLTNGVDFLLDNGNTGKLWESSPMYFDTMTQAGKEIVNHPILAFTDYKPELIEIDLQEATVTPNGIEFNLA